MIHEMTDNSNCMKTHATFRLEGDMLDPEAVTVRLHITPTFAHAKGSLFKSGSGWHKRTAGVWALETEKDLFSKCLERHIVLLLDKLEPVAVEVAKLKAEYALEADIVCGWFLARDHGGPTLRPETLGRIAQMDLILDWDFYGPYEEEG
jgi:hypothetical protein